MKTCETCEHYPDCKADPDCGELKVCEFWSNSPAEADLEDKRIKENQTKRRKEKPDA